MSPAPTPWHVDCRDRVRRGHRVVAGVLVEVDKDRRGSRSLRHHVVVASSGIRCSTSRANASAPRHCVGEAPSGLMRTYTCSPVPPDVSGKPRMPSSSAPRGRPGDAADTVERTVRVSSRSIRHSSGFSTSKRREFHGWNSTVDICTAQMTSAALVTHNSSAVRPPRKQISHVSRPRRRPGGQALLMDFRAVDALGEAVQHHSGGRAAPGTIPSPTAR